MSASHDANGAMRVPLRSLAALFLRLGAIGFGGPAAHLALMEEQVVRRRGWMTREAFLDRIAAANLLPGPSSTQVAIYVGAACGGTPGLLVAGACFIAPAMLLTAALAALYVRFGTLPAAGGLMEGVRPVVIAVVAHALVQLGRPALRTRTLAGVALAAAVAAALGAPPLAVLAAAGALALLARRGGVAAVAPLLPAVAAAAPIALPGVAAIFLAFLQLGCVLFGSGYVLVAFLRGDLVVHRHWLTEAQLLDAVAVGQLTPGPLFTTATFVGWLLRGWAGAAAATAGIFLPSFVLVAVSGRWIARIRRSGSASAFLDGVVAASLALMAVTTAQLARGALGGPVPIAIAAVSLLLLARFRVPAAGLIPAGAVLGLALRLHR